jgi:bifunctional diaminopimelate decarboxylase / aspartate kinase
MSWIVLKYGGSSLSAEGINNIYNRINKIDDSSVIIVLSAINKVTNLIAESFDNESNYNKIYNIHHDLLIELNCNKNDIFEELLLDLKKLIDNKQKIKAISYGEILSTSLVSLYFSEKKKLDIELLNVGDFLKSDRENDNNNLYLNAKYKADLEKFKKVNTKNIVITQGFIAKTPLDKTCLLGRGGSDTSAAIIANMLDAKYLEIWTDVNGVYTADPNIIKNAQIIDNISYNHAQELAAMGAKVLHPYCILPCHMKNIPIKIKNTYDPSNKKFTEINKKVSNGNNIYAITSQGNVTIYNITSLNMWNNYGFVYDIFEKFSNNGIDINIINTSQFTISTTTDHKNINKLNEIKKDLEKKYQVEMIQDCSIVSVISDSIKDNEFLVDINRISQKYKGIEMIHHSANDMTLSFVMRNYNSCNLLKDLHEKLIIKDEPKSDYSVNIKKKWWYNDIDKINSKILDKNDAIYLYNCDIITDKINTMKRELSVISKIYFAMKANNNKDLLYTIANECIGFECVSINEIEYLRDDLKIESDILFTPNFCNISEYEIAFNYSNVQVIVDNIDIIKKYIDVFKNKEIGLRIDLDSGEGHHISVITEGEKAKFGNKIDVIKSNKQFFINNNIKIVGLHSHRGSGIHNYESWYNTACKLLSLASHFSTIEWIDLGGGFGVDEGKKIDFNKLNKLLYDIKTNINFYIEPGRFIVSDAGILVCKVNQIKKKENFNYIGLSTGMNSLIRPSLYGSYHKVHNISKINKVRDKVYNLVGPICESGDIIASNRLLPETEENDIIIIENCGAYGHTMSSNYNMRESASELILSSLIRKKI